MSDVVIDNALIVFERVLDIEQARLESGASGLPQVDLSSMQIATGLKL